MVNISKSIIIYYSLTNNVVNLVKSLPENLLEYQCIEPIKKIPKSFLLSLFVAGFLSTYNRYIKTKPLSINLSKYDNIILVSPLWNGKISAVIHSFILDNKSILDSKQVAIIIVNGGSSIENCKNNTSAILAYQEFFNITKKEAKTIAGQKLFKEFILNFIGLNRN